MTIPPSTLAAIKLSAASARSQLLLAGSVLMLLVVNLGIFLCIPGRDDSAPCVRSPGNR